MKRGFIVLSVTVLLSFCVPVSLDAQYINIRPRFRTFSYEELSRPIQQAQHEYNQTMTAINSLYEYIVNVLGQDIDVQLRRDLTSELNNLDTIAKKLSETGQISNARNDYNMVFRSVQKAIAYYNNRVAQGVQGSTQNGARYGGDINIESIKYSEVRALRIGDNFKIEVIPTGAKIVKCTSDNPKVATVSSDGVITAQGAGKTNIWVYGLSGCHRCLVTVI